MVGKIEVKDAQIATKLTRLANGAICVNYDTGKYFGVVKFDEHGDYMEASMSASSSKNKAGRNFVPKDILPKGVLTAAIRAVRQQ